MCHARRCLGHCECKGTRVQALVGGFSEDLSEEMVSREPLGAPGHLNYMEEGRLLGGGGSII